MPASLFLSVILLLAASPFLFVQVDAKPGTSLESAFIRAYNERVKDGSWVSIFGNIGLLSQDFCSGSTSIWEWPFPRQNSDLLTSLQNGVFRCMYNADALILSSSGGVIINTTLNDMGRPSGAIVEWFDLLAESIRTQYNLPFYSIVWDVSLTESDLILRAVEKGDADAACGRFSAGGSITDTNVARNDVLSFMYCPSYMDIPYVWVRKNAGITTWSQLVKNVDSKGWIICVPATAGGGSERTCTALLNQTSTTDAECVGGYNAEAFDRLLTSTGCDAVLGSAPSTSSVRRNLNSFLGPAIDVQGSFFRPTDLLPSVLPNTLINIEV